MYIRHFNNTSCTSVALLPPLVILAGGDYIPPTSWISGTVTFETGHLYHNQPKLGLARHTSTWRRLRLDIEYED